MAKASKNASSNSRRKKSAKPKRLLRSSLIARTSTTSFPATVDVLFKSGLGQVTISLFRNGVLINMQSISSSGSIRLSEVQRGDSISVNGVCAGTADITINVPTNPATPEHFGSGLIITGYTIL